VGENGKEYSQEIVERAQDLYCVDGHTLDQVATITRVSVPTLKRWSVQYNWSTKRDDIRRARSAIRTNRILLHSKLIEKCLSSLNPMDAFAVSSIEGVVQRAAQLAAKGQARDTQPEVMREIKTEADAVAALEEAVESKINRLLADPAGLSFASMKEVKQALGLLKEMKAQTRSRESLPEGMAKSDEGSKAPRGLSGNLAQWLREEVLGVKKQG